MSDERAAGAAVMAVCIVALGALGWCSIAWPEGYWAGVCLLVVAGSYYDWSVWRAARERKRTNGLPSARALKP